MVGDKRFEGLSPRDAHQAGIAVVYQKLRFGPFVRKRTHRRDAGRR